MSDFILGFLFGMLVARYKAQVWGWFTRVDKKVKDGIDSSLK